MYLLLYYIFSIGLFLWTTVSIRYEITIPYTGYLAGVALLGLCVLIVYITSRKSGHRTVFEGVTIVGVLANIGMSVNYRCTNTSETIPEMLKGTYIFDMLLMVFAFLFMYLFIRYTKAYKFKTFNLLVAVGLPLSILGARLSGRMTGGSYLYFAGFMIFGWVLMGFPFTASWFLSLDENRYWKGKVGNISWNLIIFLFYTFMLYAGCALCNEYGLLLIIGLTSTVLFFIRCKDLKSKIFYTIACAGGALFAGMKSPHLLSRIKIWIDPIRAYENVDLNQKAESILYLFRHFNSMGWWGNGIGHLSNKIYPTLDSDHVLILLMNDYSIILMLLVVILGIIFVRWMLIQPRSASIYDRYLNLTCALIIGFIIVVDLASNLGSFVTAGIGFPWISDGSSINIMLTVLMAIHCGLLRKKVMEDASSPKEN